MTALAKDETTEAVTYQLFDHILIDDVAELVRPRRGRL